MNSVCKIKKGNYNIIFIAFGVFAILYIINFYFIFKYNDLLLTEGIENNNKIAIVSAIYGNYDNLKEQNVNNANLVDWFCFTDNTEIKNNGYWKIINKPYHLINPTQDNNYKNNFNNISTEDKRTFNMMCAKYYKLQGHNIDILKKYNYIIWVDGSLFLRPDYVDNIIKLVKHNYNLVNFKHNGRDNIKDELEASLIMDKYVSQDLWKQYDEYMSQGFTDRIGLFENTMIIRKNIGYINKLFDEWWEHNLKYSYQDQISYPFVLWKHRIIPDYIINMNVFDNDTYSYVNPEFMNNH